MNTTEKSNHPEDDLAVLLHTIKSGCWNVVRGIPGCYREHRRVARRLIKEGYQKI